MGDEVAALDSFVFNGLPRDGQQEQGDDESDIDIFDEDDDEDDDEEYDEEGKNQDYGGLFPDGYRDAETEKSIFSDLAASSSENDDTSSEYSSSTSTDYLSSTSASYGADSDSNSGVYIYKKSVSIDQSLQLLQEIHTLPSSAPPLPPLDPSDLTTLFIRESQNPRYVIKTGMKRFLHIFPWLSTNPKARYRELFNRNDAVARLEDIIVSLKYWYAPRQKSFSAEELGVIRDYYLRNPFPMTEFMLSHIIKVTSDIHQLLHQDHSAALIPHPAVAAPLSPTSQTTHDHSSSADESAASDHTSDSNDNSATDPASLEAHLNLHDRIDLHEQQLNEIQVDVTDLRVRRGGDRAGWLRIRSEDLATRAQWCVEGGVFGAYADGVGPLVPCDVRRKKSVIVYSTDPDTVEDLPDPENPDRFVRYVMVGEAPVKLCDDAEYRKYKKLKQNVEVYVNFKGEVRCRSLRITENSKQRVAFATADAYLPGLTPLDDEGYPTFQGTRGIRCRIHGIQDLRRSNYSDMMASMSDLTPEERKKKKRSIMAKVGIGLTLAGVAASVLALSLLDSPKGKHNNRNRQDREDRERMDTSSSSFSSASSGGGGTDGERQVVDLATASLTNELLLLKNKKRAVETELEELARKPPEGKNKKQLRELKEELEEKLQKIKKKIKKLKQELEELGVGDR